MGNKKKNIQQRGAVSLFVVIFVALLVIVVTIGFIQLMIKNQEQASIADLSQSAYDSAQSGVEDAKRALVSYREVCNSDGNGERCAAQDRVIAAASCDTLQKLGVSSGSKEVVIKQAEGDSALQQAYTCVKMKLNSPDYLGTLDASQSRVVPLRGTGAFNRVTVEWFVKGDLKNPTDSIDLSADAQPQLPKLAEWPENRPAFMRTQLIQYGSNFTLSDFDNAKDGKSNTNTLFLYPSQLDTSSGDNTFNFMSDVRRSQESGVLQQVKCAEELTDTLYACKATLVLPEPINPNADGIRGGAYLRLNGIYNTGNDFRVKLYRDATPVEFAGVQAVVDSTGRANDQFRRVESRVELDVSIFPYPDAAIDITGNLCKDFLITDNPADYVSNDDECDPTKYKSE